MTIHVHVNGHAFGNEYSWDGFTICPGVHEDYDLELVIQVMLLCLFLECMIM